MSLIVCRECGKEMSAALYNCPHCGSDWPRKDADERTKRELQERKQRQEREREEMRLARQKRLSLITGERFSCPVCHKWDVSAAEILAGDAYFEDDVAPKFQCRYCGDDSIARLFRPDWSRILDVHGHKPSYIPHTYGEVRSVNERKVLTVPSIHLGAHEWITTCRYHKYADITDITGKAGAEITRHNDNIYNPDRPWYYLHLPLSCSQCDEKNRKEWKKLIRNDTWKKYIKYAAELVFVIAIIMITMRACK
jgi:predicted RNA-binding Zn-ribbon protein involved in translation (DUF1610 family)